MRLFLDANVLFTAALSPDGHAAALVRLAEHGECELLTSPHTLTEANRNLKLKYSETVGRLEKEIMPRVTIVVEATPRAVRVGLAIGLPLEDAPILGAALQAGADVLVTGDARHFRHLYTGTVEGIRVASPATALTTVLGSRRNRSRSRRYQDQKK